MEISTTLDTAPKQHVQRYRTFLLLGIAAIVWWLAYRVVQPLANWLT